MHTPHHTPKGDPVNGATTVVGIIGHPVSHSHSPQMHNAAFHALGLNWVYVPFPLTPDRLADGVRGLAAAGVRGFNVTIPHKEKILPLLDEISPQARAIGAVNTVVIDNGKLVGHNTDGVGFSHALHQAHRFKPERSRVLVLGAGGSARAVCDQLAREGVPAMYICARRSEQAADLSADLRSHHPGCDIKTLDWSPLDHRCGINWAELIVNTTPIGMRPGDGSPLDTNGISPGHIVVDLIYAPPETELLQKCRALRARCLNGLGMLLHQGAAAFTLWTGKEAPLDVMQAALPNHNGPA
ncbi:MAG: shikimate dehydrogenase [Nitrospirota bacterium]|nr:shikimate dehydrogenase [Nitrospirota bacterium]